MEPAHLTDFGLAKAIATGSKYTRTGQALGTPAYMSPEQARGETAALTPATDVWALGCILYELLAGRRAFEGETPAEVIAGVLTREPRRLRGVRPDVPTGLDLVLRVCLAKTAGHRYPSAREMVEDLDRVLRNAAPRARAPGARRRRAIAAMVGAALVASGAVLAWPREPSAVAVPATRDRSEAEVLAVRAHALRGSDPGGAADLLRSALAYASDRHDWRLDRGLLLWAVGRGPEARDEWARIPDGSPVHLAARLYTGLEAFSRLDALLAIGDLDAAATGPGSTGKLARAAAAALNRDWPAARAALRDESGWIAALLVGFVEGTDPGGDRVRAERAYTAVLEQGLPFAWVHANRAALRDAVGDHEGALRDTETALRLAPGQAKLHYDRGVARRARGDVQGALDDFEAALGLDPDYAHAYLNRGNIRRDVGDVAGALRDYHAAVRLDPTDALAWYNRGHTHHGLGDLASAMADYDAAIAVDPRYAPAYANRALLRQNAGELDAALRDLDRAVELGPATAPTHLNRGVVRQARGDLAGAIRDFDTALELDPRLPEAFGARARARDQSGNPAGAADDYAHALEVAPPGWRHRPEAAAQLARLRAVLAEGHAGG